MKRLWFVAVVLCLAGADNCSHNRTADGARHDATRILRVPVICDGTPNDGFICVDNHGGVVLCPAQDDKPCTLSAGGPETPGSGAH